MKLTTVIPAVVLALLALNSQVRAQNATYSVGDVIIGFEQQNGAAADDYLVDLGPVSQFITPSAPTLTFQLSTTDLTAVFGSSWANNSQTNLVQWGLIAGANKGTPTAQPYTLNGDVIPGDTIFFSQGELVPGTHSTAPTEHSASTQNGYLGNVANLDTGSGGFAGTTLTGNGAFQAIDETHGATNSWSYEISTKSNFGTGINIQQPLTGAGTGPTDSILDFYELTPNNGSTGTLLGDFSLDSTGLLTFTDFSNSIVPEPSSSALLMFGGALLLIATARRKAQQS